jgi:hypothetical protein
MICREKVEQSAWIFAKRPMSLVHGLSNLMLDGRAPPDCDAATMASIAGVIGTTLINALIDERELAG